MLKTMKQMLAMLCVTAMCCLMIPAWTVAAETYGDIQYTIIKDEANVIGYIGSPTDVVIPDTLGGYPVKRIQNSSFDGCTSMESVSIPASVTSIGADAFRNCTSLTAVHISDIDAWCSVAFGANGGGNDANPLYYAGNLYLNGELVTDLVFAEGLTKVNEYAFYNCTSLKSVVLSDSVTTIGSNAFEKCTSLESIYIPVGVTQIGIYAFYKCNSLADVYYGGNQEQWEAIAYSFGNDLLTDASNIQYTPAMHYNVKAIGYDNTYVNTGYGAADLIGVAETQVGYLEGTLEGNTYIDNNYQKYGVWYDEAVENINAANSVWDAVFVAWCADQANIPDSVIPRNAYVPYSTTWFKNKGLYYDSEAQGGSYIPEKGDLIFFGDTMPTHMGIVTEVTDTYVRTIEGNATDPSDAYGLTQGVFTKQYNLNYTRIFGYATPAYDAAINPLLVSYYKGDVNADWMVSTTDARNILMDVLTDSEVAYNAVADFDQNGAVNTSDARELVVDVINDVAPTLVTPPPAAVTGMPSGKGITFSETASVELWGGDVTSDECYVVQSLEELQAFYADDEGFEDYTASFTEDFFRANALVLVKVSASSLPKATYVSGIVKSDDNALTIHLIEEYNAGLEPIIYHERILLTLAKADLADVTEVCIYTQTEIEYELL